MSSNSNQPQNGSGAPSPGPDPTEEIPDTIPAIEEQRVLVGFMGPDDAVGWLQQSKRVRNPIDLAEREEMDEAEIEQHQEAIQQQLLDEWEAAQKAIPEIEGVGAGSFGVEELPNDPAVQSHLDEYAGKDGFQEAMSDVPDIEWKFKRVPIAALVAFQPQVTTTAYEDISTWSEDPAAVLEYCFPTEQSTLQMTGVNADDDGNRAQAFIVSRSPNFQLGGVGIDSGGPTSDIQVQVKPKPNFLQVVRFQDRYILKNGYHRTYQLMQAGEEFVPAVVHEVDDYQLTGAAKEGAFPPEVVLGDRPPMMPDFNSGAAVTLETPATNTVIEVVADKKQIPR